jgi:hypothetical protein
LRTLIGLGLRTNKDTKKRPMNIKSNDHIGVTK